jgi:uncharacterized protein GlcG (DUF336 family)
MSKLRSVVLAAATIGLLAIGPFTASSQQQELGMFDAGRVPKQALTADMAIAIAQGALEKCRADGFHVTITVVDATDTPKIVIRDDGENANALDVARRKAFTALAYKRASSEQAKIWRAMTPPVFLPTDAIPLPGGVPIRKGNDVIGAVGISGAPGGDPDEVCGLAGIAKIAEKLK